MNVFLYELLEDYQFAETEAEREEIFCSFCRLLWDNPNKRIVLEKPITFRIKPKLLATETGQIFAAYASICRSYSPSVTESRDFASLIRQKLNNIYTYYFDKDVCCNKEYLDLLRLPKKLYLQWQSSCRTKDASWTLSPQELSLKLEDAMKRARIIKENCARKTMDLDWQEYAKLTEKYFRRMFDHYKPLEEYQNRKELAVYDGAWEEDHFCIRYFCRGLEGYIKSYQKKYYGLYNVNSHGAITYGRCACGNLFLQNKRRNRRLCDCCRKQSRNLSYKRYNLKRDTPSSS